MNLDGATICSGFIKTRRKSSKMRFFFAKRNTAGGKASFGDQNGSGGGHHMLGFHQNPFFFAKRPKAGGKASFGNSSSPSANCRIVPSAAIKKSEQEHRELLQKLQEAEREWELAKQESQNVKAELRTREAAAQAAADQLDRERTQLEHSTTQNLERSRNQIAALQQDLERML